MIEEDEILDLPEEKKAKKNFVLIFWTSIPFFGYWFFAQIADLPYFQQSLIIGAAVLYLFILLRFVDAESKPTFQYFYFLGKSFLLAGTVLRLLNFYFSFYLFVLSVLFFAVGVLFTFNWRKK